MWSVTSLPPHHQERTISQLKAHSNGYLVVLRDRGEMGVIEVVYRTKDKIPIFVKDFLASSKQKCFTQFHPKLRTPSRRTPQIMSI